MSRQMIESPGEAGVGNILTSVAVGCGDNVIATGVTASPVDEQAVSINKTIKLMNGIPEGFFIQK